MDALTQETKQKNKKENAIIKKNNNPTKPKPAAKKPLNIVCLTHFYIEENRAGGEMMLHALLASLAKAGHNVKALITDTARLNTVIDGVEVIYGVDHTRVLDTYDYDVVVSQFQNTPTSMAHAHRLNKPFIHVVHNDMPLTIQYINETRVSDLNVFNTQWIKDKAEIYTRSQTPNIIVHPPVDRKAMKMKKKPNGEYVTLVNLTEPKGSDMFYSLARRMTDVKFLGVLGGYWKDRQVVKSDLPNVTIIDNTPNMNDDVYSKSKVVLMPSTYESFGMVAAEAIVNGIPVIATPTAGLMENLGAAGIYAPRGVGDVDKWEIELRKLLSDKSYYEKASADAIERSKVIDTELELKEFVKKVEEVVYANI